MIIFAQMSPEKPQRNGSYNSEKCNLPTQCYDPLEGLGDYIPESKFYRVDSVVFAEPLTFENEEKTEDIIGSRKNIDEEETTLLDNVTIRKRPGKRKKLYVHLHDNSNLTCPLPNCKKTFSSSILLKAHIRKVHCSEKSFTCEVCGAMFSAHYLLKRHAAVHELKKVQCPICKKMLSQRTNLSVHLRSHSDTRPHECPTCGKRFLRRATLRVHSGVHRETSAAEVP